MYLGKVDCCANYRFFPILKMMYVSQREERGVEIYFLPIWKEGHTLIHWKKPPLVQQNLKSKKKKLYISSE